LTEIKHKRMTRRRKRQKDKYSKLSCNPSIFSLAKNGSGD